MLKFHLLIILISSLLLGNCNKKTEEAFTVEIYQDNKLIPIQDHIVELDRSSFTIEVQLNNHPGVYINGSTNDEYYNLKEDQEIRDYQYLPYKAFAELQFNEDQQIILDPDGFHFLFYDPKLDWHRFDADIIKEGNKIIGTKKVTNFWYKGDEMNSGLNHGNKDDLKINVNEIEDDIYLFFIATLEEDNDDKYSNKILEELKRDKIKIEWQ